LIKAQIPKNQEEVHSSQTMEKITSERHSVIQEEENPSSYNIEEIFEAFTFNLYKKEVSQKRVQNEKQNDGDMKEV
jgi:transcriptional regulator NrdR family protein